MRPTWLVLLAVLVLGCAAEPTSTIVPSDTPDPVATAVASIKMTLTAEAAGMPTATPTDTATPTATATPADTPTPTPSPAAQLEGQVLDEGSGQPLAGAQVAAGERQTTTDSEGRFLFADLAPGPYTVLVTAADHDPVLSGIVDARAGKQVVVDAALPAAGTGEYPRDPMASNQIDPAGAPSAREAERLARLQGLQGAVVSVREVTLKGEYLVNYKKGTAIRAAMATLHHPAWELVDEAGQAWYIVRVCGNLAVVRPAQVKVPAQCVATPHPVVTVGDDAIVGCADPSEPCDVVAELPAGWHGIALACSHECKWLHLQFSGIANGCWVRRDQVEVLGDLDSIPVYLAGKIAFFSDRHSPGSAEIYLMNPDGSEQTRLTSGLQVSRSQVGGPPGVLDFRWSSATQKFFFSTMTGGLLYAVDADGSGAALLAQRVFGIDLSPDGQRIVAGSFSSSTSRNDIAILNSDGTGKTVVTDSATRADLGLGLDTGLHGPAWSPDGTWIAFYSHNPERIFMIHLDGSAPVAYGLGGQIIAGSYMDWSHDNRHLIFHQEAPPSLGILDVTTGVVTDVFRAEWLWHPSWSPDGSRIAFDWYVESEGTDRDSQIWVINADGSGLAQLTFEGKNCCPVWLR